jgi:hypothetical protein
MDERERIIAAADAHRRIKEHFIYIMGMIPRVREVLAMPVHWTEEHFEDRAEFIFLGKPCRLKMNFAWLDTNGFVGQVVLQMKEDDGTVTDVRPVFLIDVAGNFFLSDFRRRPMSSQDPMNLAAIVVQILGMLVPGPRQN